MTQLLPWLWLLGFLWVAFGLWLYLFSKHKDNVLCKAFTTGGPVLLALFGALWRPTPPSWTLFAAACLFLLADILINSSLLPGVAVFLLGHLVLIVRCFLLGSGWAALLFPGALGCLALAFIYRRRLKNMGALAVALLVYVFVLFGMAGSIFSLYLQTLSTANLLASAGVLLFLASDLLLGDIIVTGRKSRTKDCWVMCLYEAAVLLLVLSPFAV